MRFGPYCVAMITPFTENGEIDWSGVSSMVDLLVGSGVEQLMVSGSTGEQHSMTPEERLRLYHSVVRAAAGRAQVIAGVAATTTRVAQALAEAAVTSGVDGIMLGLPPYLRPSVAEQIEYVSTVAVKAGVPVMLYNNPARTGTDVDVETVVALAERGHIVALKESASYEKGMEVDERTGGKVKLLTGNDRTFLEAVALGYSGITSIFGNLFPREMGEVVSLAVAGESDRAEARYQSLTDAAEAVLAPPLPVGLKYAMRRLGMKAGYCRKPLGIMTPEQTGRIDGALSRMATGA